MMRDERTAQPLGPLRQSPPLPPDRGRSAPAPDLGGQPDGWRTAGLLTDGRTHQSAHDTHARGRDVLPRWGSQEIFGQVVWSEGNEAGVAFHKPILPEELVETVGGEVPAALPTGRRVL